MLPNFLTHYYEAACGPFLNLSDLSLEEAEIVQQRIRLENNRFASRRQPEYLLIRRGLENRIRGLFIAKGGQPRRERPHYMIVGPCPWVQAWYAEGREARIPFASFSPSAVSFTYGDSFPAMHMKDGRPYRAQVYTLAELHEVVAQYGLPQDWNPTGAHGPERYIEAQVWEDEPITEFLLHFRLCMEDQVPQR